MFSLLTGLALDCLPWGWQYIFQVYQVVAQGHFPSSRDALSIRFGQQVDNVLLTSKFRVVNPGIHGIHAVIPKSCAIAISSSSLAGKMSLFAAMIVSSPN